MSLYVPGQDGGFVHSDASDLAWKLQHGDGLTWSGDPRLELRIGVATQTKGGVATGKVGRRYEVWRHTPDGEDVRIGHWRMDEYHQILPDIVLMRAGAEGRIDGVVDRLEANEAKIEKDSHDKFRDSYGEIAEHALNLRWESIHGKTFFGQAGKGLPVDSKDAD